LNIMFNVPLLSLFFEFILFIYFPFKLDFASVGSLIVGK
jgi:hypothetical protein